MGNKLVFEMTPDIQIFEVSPNEFFLKYAATSTSSYGEYFVGVINDAKLQALKMAYKFHWDALDLIGRNMME